MQTKKNLIAAAVAAALIAPAAQAAFIDMEGNFVLTSISTDGTLGRGGTTDPGLRHDPDGTGSFPDSEGDYLTPGTPWELFSFRSDQTGVVDNNNSSNGGDDDGFTSLSLEDVSLIEPYDQAVLWTGQLLDGSGAAVLEMRQLYYFNDGDERVNIETTITALTDLTGVSFLRSIDPDPDVDAGGSFSTVNSRGIPSLGVAASDFVGSEGPLTGLTLGLFSDSPVTHNTGISSGWSDDPLFYLAGTNDGTPGDYTIGIAFDIGSLGEGESVVLRYAYVMGDSIETVDIPGEVPEPATLALLGFGLFGAAAMRRRRNIG